MEWMQNKMLAYKWSCLLPHLHSYMTLPASNTQLTSN